MQEVTIDYEGSQMTLSALDLSTNGVGVWGPARCPAGPFKVSFPIDDGGAALKATGRVVRQYHSDGGSVWGIQFTEIDEASARRLAEFVASLSSAA